MKKLLLTLPFAALLATGLANCSGQQGWNTEERRSMHEALRDYRRMVYLEDLDDPEFTLFTDGVVRTLEMDYPIYTAFVSMPGAEDTVETVVVTAIVAELDADAHNMRHLYPYPYFVAQGVLPPGLDRRQQKAFYQCFASKVNSSYRTMDQFFGAVLADTTDRSQLALMAARCAADLFGQKMAEIDGTVD